MFPYSFTRCVLAVAALCLAGLVGSLQAEVVYRETFNNNVGQSPLSDVGWYAYYGNAATNATLAVPGSTGNPANGMISGGPSAGGVLNPAPPPTYYQFPADVNADPHGPHATADGANGFATIPCMHGVYDYLVYTSEYTVDRSHLRIASLQMNASATAIGDAIHAAVQIGGNWYATIATVSPPMQTDSGGSVFQAEAVTLPMAFNTSAGAWQKVNFGIGTTPLTLGNVLATALPAGNVTAFGMFYELADDPNDPSYRATPRFDNFTVNAAVLGDFNSDGKVNDADYTVWADYYKKAPPANYQSGDDPSKGYDDADYTTWADHYGYSAPGVVPEPGTMALLAGGLLALRRRKNG